MALGTAPRRVSSGVWVTRTGRKLTPAGGAYWENLYRSGRTSGTGHMTQPSVVQQKPTPPTRPAAPKTPTRLQLALAQAASQGQADRRRPDVQQAIRASRAYHAAGDTLLHPRDLLAPVRAAGAVGRGVGGTMQQLGIGLSAASRGTSAGTTRARAARETVPRLATQAGNITIGPDLTAAIQGRKASGLGLGLDVAMLPLFGVGPVRGARAAIAGTRELAAGAGREAAVEAAGAAYRGPGLLQSLKRPYRGIWYEQRFQQVPTARSAFAQHVFERPMDWASKALMGDSWLSRSGRKALGSEVGILPKGTTEMRVPKYAGREQVTAEATAQASMAKHMQALPEAGTVEDIAHSWYHQLPDEHMNAQGLQRLRDLWGREHEQVVSGSRLKSVQEELAAVDEAINQAEYGSDDYWELLEHKGALRQAVTDLTPVEMGGRQIWSPLERDLGLSLTNLDKTIQADVKPDQKILNAMKELTGDREETLIDAGLLTPEGVETRSNLVPEWLGLEGGGANFLGHRLTEGRRTMFPGRGGVGRPRIPAGLSKRNELILARSGRLRQSTHVAAEDWLAAQNYRQQLKAREVLGQMGRPFTDRYAYDPETEVVVNPEGKVVPAKWKRDEMAWETAHGADEGELYDKVKELTSGYVAKGDSELDQMIEQARQQGVDLHNLRVVKKKVADRYYAQFTKAPPAGAGMRNYDKAVDIMAAHLIFLRLGYIPKNAVQNALMAAPHQGIMGFFNMPRAAQILNRRRVNDELGRQVYDHMAAQVGLGGAGTIGQELSGGITGTVGKVIEKGPEVSSKIADLPFRMSAFIHEAAAEGVIPRFKGQLSDEDMAKLLDLMTNPEKEADLANIRSRAVEAMADFSRLTPDQRRTWRRLAIIPGWLWAGSRYPVHFAATHPGRSAALAYVAAGEPGLPEGTHVGPIPLPKNRPLDEYFAKNVPTYAQGVMGPGGLWRTGSVSPYDTPFSSLQSLTFQGGRTPADLVNPLIPAAVNVGKGTYELSSGETKRTRFWNNLQENLVDRFFPGYKAVAEMGGALARGQVSGGVPAANRIYPDRSFLGQLRKEVGVGPIAYNPVAGERTRANQLGLSNTAKLLSDKIKTQERMAAQGYDFDSDLQRAYAINVQRQRRTDKLLNAGYTGLGYYKRAMKSDADLALKIGAIDKETRDGLYEDARSAQSESQLKRWRNWMRNEYFDGKMIRETKDWLNQQEAQAAPAGG